MDEQQQFFEIIHKLIDGWCERRYLRPLSILLPAWLGFSGLTDSWYDLREALRHVRAMTKETLPAEEKEQLGKVIAMLDKAL